MRARCVFGVGFACGAVSPVVDSALAPVSESPARPHGATTSKFADIQTVVAHGRGLESVFGAPRDPWPYVKNWPTGFKGRFRSGAAGLSLGGVWAGGAVSTESGGP